MTTEPAYNFMLRFVGVDLHKNNFTACFYRQGKCTFQTLPVSETGLNNFRKKLSSKDHVAVEATGNSRFFRKAIEPYVASVSLVPTSGFAVIKKSTKKTDKNDAALLAFFLSKNMLPTVRPRRDEYQHLLSLIKLRQHFLIMDRTLLNVLNGFLNSEGVIVPKNKLKTISGFKKYTEAREWPQIAKEGVSSIKIGHEFFKKIIKNIESEINMYSQLLPGYQDLRNILGIGEMSAPIFLCTIDDISNFLAPPKLASYFGMVPSVRISNGKRESGRMTKRGSKIARSAIIQCAWVRVRTDKNYKKYYERHRKNKGSKRAIVVCARKLLNEVYFTLMNRYFAEKATRRRTVKKQIATSKRLPLIKKNVKGLKRTKTAAKKIKKALKKA